MDFVHDRLIDRRAFRDLTVIDQFTREYLALVAAPTWLGKGVAAALETVAPDARGAALDHGRQRNRIPESRHGRLGISPSNHAQLHSSGQASGDTFIESSDRPLRDEGLNTQQFLSLADVQRQLDLRRCDYYVVRPHSALDDRTPNEMRRAHEAGDTQVSPLRLTDDRQPG